MITKFFTMLIAVAITMAQVGFASAAGSRLPELRDADHLDYIQAPIVVVLVTSDECHRPCDLLADAFANQRNEQNRYAFIAADSDTVGLPSWQAPAVMAYIPGLGPVYQEEEFDADPAAVESFMVKLDAFFNRRVELASIIQSSRESMQELDTKIEQLTGKLEALVPSEETKLEAAGMATDLDELYATYEQSLAEAKAAADEIHKLDGDFLKSSLGLKV
jgi:hypothetical protein